MTEIKDIRKNNLNHKNIWNYLLLVKKMTQINTMTDRTKRISFKKELSKKQ